MGEEFAHRYLIGVGSNMRHHRHGAPREVVREAIGALASAGFEVSARSAIIASDPIGPSSRRFANAAVTASSRHNPRDLLGELKRIESTFGRRTWRRWGARVLDLDIVLWSGGAFGSPDLCIPHPLFRERSFVLAPAATIAPAWRDPVSGLTVRQLHHRLTRPVPLPR